MAAGKPKKVVLTACSHKLLRVLNVMARTGQPWNDDFHPSKVDMEHSLKLKSNFKSNSSPRCACPTAGHAV